MILNKPKSATSESDSLSALADQINEQHDQATRHATSALEHARRAGVLLQEAKQQVGHGDWLTWLADNCKVSARQSQRYLKVANNWQAIAKNDAASYLTIDEAIESTKPEPDVAVDIVNGNKATTVVNVKTDSFDIYIGRENKRRGYPASKWANPFVVGKDGNRDEVIAKYVAWFPHQAELVASVHEIRGKRLGCWCHPLPCHGDFLAELADKAPAKPPSKNDAASYLTIDEAIALTQQSDKPLVTASEDTDLTMAADTREVAVFEPAEPAEDRKPYAWQGSGDNEWYSPADYVAAGRDVLGAIDLDPASSHEANAVVNAAKFYTADDDGLQQPWRGRLWINPPYAKDLCAQFIEKLVDDLLLGDVSEAVLLVNNATETQWFQMAMRASSAVCFPSKRARFWKPDRSGLDGQPRTGQAVFYFGSDTSKFAKAFAKFGEVLGRIGGAE